MLYRGFGPSRVQTARDLVLLFGLALVLRLCYLWLGVQGQSLNDMCLWAHDTKIYLGVAHYWLTGDPAGEQAMLLAGPGYGLILAGLQAVFGVSAWPPLLFNVLLGCAAPVVVYLLALTLVGKRPVAMLAGLMVCLSVTSLSVSTSLLSDQPFYTLHGLALLLFARGWQTGRSSWYVTAGCIAGVATWIRAMGQVWPVVFVFVAFLLALLEPGPGRWGRFGRTLWTPLILMLFILSWSAFNYSRHGVFTLTTNGARSAWLYLSAKAVALHTPGLNTETAKAQIAAELQRESDSAQAEIDMYHLSLHRVKELARSHPWWLVDAFVHNVWENVQEPNYLLSLQLRRYKVVLDVFIRQARGWLNEWMFWGSVLGMALLVKHRLHLAWVLAGTTFLAFTVLTGFSFWEGSRLQYPAEMGWSILLSYFFVHVWAWASTLPNRESVLARP